MERVFLARVIIVLLLISTLFLSRFDTFTALDNIFAVLVILVSLMKQGLYRFQVCWLFFLIYAGFNLIEVNHWNFEKFFAFYQPVVLNFGLLLSASLIHKNSRFAVKTLRLIVFLFNLLLLHFIYHDFLDNESVYVLGRAVGILDDANRFGRVMLYGLVINWVYLGRAEESFSIIQRVVKFILSIAYVYAIVLSGSRMSVIVLFILILYACYVTLKSSLRLFLFRFILGSIIFWKGDFYTFLLNTKIIERFSTIDRGIDIRGEAINSAKLAFEINPVFGVGIGQISVRTGSGLNAHHDLYEILGSLGLVGIVIYIAFWLLILRRFIRLGIRHRIDLLALLLIILATAFGTWHFISIYTFVIILFIELALRKDEKKSSLDYG